MIAPLLLSVALAAPSPETAARLPELGLTPAQIAAVEAIFASSEYISTGYSPATRHPMSLEQCRARRADAGAPLQPDPAALAVCGRPYMVPLYDPASQSPAEATACIDQYEFPGVPCAFPVTQVRADEAAQICAAMGKRLCDAHEWEGGCAGALTPPDYRFDLAKGRSMVDAVKAMRAAHNAAQGASKRWATGSQPPGPGVCAQGSTKSPQCDGGDVRKCGTNTYPTGAFPQCVSPLGVYDQHGNAAEHMNLPLAPDQLSSAGGAALGVTEMKGSWFIWETYRAHEDWCRWRAPFWHGTKVEAAGSHRNYHLGFRCCADARTAP